MQPFTVRGPYNTAIISSTVGKPFLFCRAHKGIIIQLQMRGAEWAGPLGAGRKMRPKENRERLNGLKNGPFREKIMKRASVKIEGWGVGMGGIPSQKKHAYHPMPMRAHIHRRT